MCRCYELSRLVSLISVRCAETIVDLREKSMSDLKRLHGAGRVSDSVLAQARVELLEARIRAARVRGRTK